ncbi:MAG: ABC transporter substrate-binding protein [bacterium]
MLCKKGMAALLFGVVVSTMSCSILSDFSECENDSDCAARYGAGNTCSDGVCQTPNAANLLGGTCTESSGDITASGSLNFGVIMPLTGDEAGFGLPLVNAMKLAQADVNKIGGVNGQKVGLIICDSLNSAEGAVAAAQHLTQNARVPVVIGSDSSGQTIEVATQVTIPAEVVQISPSATAGAISTLADNNLLWRTCPSDNAQGAALAKYIEQLVNVDLQSSFDDVTIWVLGAEDEPYSSGLQDILTATLPTTFVTSDRFLPRSYPSAWQDWFVNSTSDLAEPDIVVLLGFAESWDIAEEIDRRFPGNIRYVAVDGAKNAQEAARTSPTLQGRFSGVAPQNVGEASYLPYLNFATKYRSAYDADPNDLQFVANAYDAVIIAALGAAAGGTTGPQIADGMTRISGTGPETLLVSGAGESLSAGFAALIDGQTVNYEGASGPLDMDTNGEPANTAIALWCFADLAVPEQAVVYLDGKYTPASCGADTNNTMMDMGADVGAEDAGADAGDMGTD